MGQQLRGVPGGGPGRQLKTDMPGGGPWRILDECPAPSHNSLNAARGRSGTPACICPRARMRMQMRTDYEAERRRTGLTAAAAKEWRDAQISKTTPEPITARTQPDFTGGLCTTEWGKELADNGYTDSVTPMGVMRREETKEMCRECPLLVQCHDWVTGQEKPAGSWGGIWAGLDPWNRRGKDVVVYKDETGKRKAKVISYVND